jgi:hypothetical protein
MSYGGLFAGHVHICIKGFTNAANVFLKRYAEASRETKVDEHDQVNRKDRGKPVHTIMVVGINDMIFEGRKGTGSYLLV